jgi:hypothetical protein
MGRTVVTLFVLLCVVATCLPAQAQIITKVERRNPDADSGDTQPAIAPSPLGEKSLCFVDRTHVWVTIPEILLGAQYIMTANDDKNNQNHELDVTLSKATTMYLFLDNRVGTGTGNSPTTNPNLVAGGMTWITDLGFVDTGINVAIDESNDGTINQWFSIYSLSVPAGKITLKGQNNAYNMYGVGVRGEPVVKATKPSPADGEEGVTLPLFQWKAGPTAVVHNVYLGTSGELAVADLVGPRNVGTAFFYGPGLVPGQTYYWRVDEVEADMVTVHTGDVWSFVAASMAAWKPTPQDGLGWIDPNTALSWGAGKDAFSHDVYFGTDKAAVESGDAGAFRENTFFATWKPAGRLTPDTTYFWRVDEVAADGKKETGQVWSFVTWPDVPITDPNMLGWWQLDEGMGALAFDSSGHANHGTIQGAEWVEGILGDALKFNGAQSVDLPAALLQSKLGSVACWVKTTQSTIGMIFYGTATAGNGYGDENEMHLSIDTSQARFYIEGGAADASVWSGATINNGEWQHVAATWDATTVRLYLNGAQVSQAANTGNAFTASAMTRLGRPAASERFYVGLLDDVRFYNRAVSADEIIAGMRGDPLVAWNPQPARGVTVDLRGAAELSWSAGDTAAKHDVYFGKDRAVVANADTAAPEYKIRQTATTYPLGGLVEFGGGAYFWRIDEVEADGKTIHKGAVWTFTIPDYLLVDDFERYTDNSPDRVFQTWLDGLGFSEDEFFPTGNPGNGTSSIVGYDPQAGNIMETSIIHGGRQSMPVEYNNVNSPYYAEVERTWSTPQNLKLGGVTDLSLWFQGYPEGFAQSATGIAMSSAGTDIWNTADQFRFAFKRLTGDGWIIAKVESIGNTDVWAKAGVMIRGTLDADSRFAYNIVSAASGVSFGRREMTATAATSAPAVPGTAPYWVKLTRTGDILKAETSADGKTWTAVATDPALSSATVAMTGSLYIGLCVTSHNTNAKIVTTGVFSNISTSPSVTGQWQVAEVGIDSPENSAQDLYVVLQDSAGKTATVTYPNGSNAAAWTEWKIPLGQFAGVNVGGVKKMFIGLGNRKSPKPDGGGRMFFDDIRVLKPTP